MLHVIIPACNLIPKPRNSNHRCFMSSPHQATPSTHRATASSLTTWPSVPSLSAATQVSSTTSTNSPARSAPAKSQGLHESRRLPTVLFTLTNHIVYYGRMNRKAMAESCEWVKSYWCYEAGKAATCMTWCPPHPLIRVREGLRAGEVVGEGRRWHE